MKVVFVVATEEPGFSLTTVWNNAQRDVMHVGTMCVSVRRVASWSLLAGLAAIRRVVEVEVLNVVTSEVQLVSIQLRAQWRG